MTAENNRIHRYQYELRVEPDGDGTRQVGLLYLYGSRDSLLAVCAAVGESGEPLSAPVESPNGHVAVQLAPGQLDTLIDILRNEKPIYFGWSPEARIARITTADEPVGEQELRKLLSFLYI